jgi:hypothetical protein
MPSHEAPHQDDDHHHPHESVTPGADLAECPVMPGRHVNKTYAGFRGWIARLVRS